MRKRAFAGIVGMVMLILLGLMAGQCLAEVAINEGNFPDEAFRSYISNNFDKDKDGLLSSKEIAEVVSMYADKGGFKSLKGLEYFTALRSLSCSYNQLTALDVSKNTALTELYCADNQLTALDVNKNTALLKLGCNDNQLIALNVTNNIALTDISCGGNQLATLDVSKNTALTELYCDGNHLTELNLSKNAALEVLYCTNNQLTALDVSNNTTLWHLYCSNNQLTALNVDNCTALEELDCTNNLLTRLYISGCPKLNSFSHDEGLIMLPEGEYGLAINEENFPDEVFRSYINTYIDTGIYRDGFLSSEEIAKVKGISVRRITRSSSVATTASIKSLKGIEYFTALTYLDCSNNELAELDVSKNTALTELYCGKNQLTELDVSKNTALVSLDCYNNKLTTLDISKNIALTSLECYNNELASLDISPNITLAYLSCGGNKMTELDLHGCIALRELDLSNSTALTTLWCYDNKQLTKLYASDCPALTAVYCHKNQLTELDLYKCTALTKLNCSNNQISNDDILTIGLNIRKCTALTSMDCSHNQLTDLNLRENTALRDLNCSYNQLTNLDLRKNTALTNLACSDNQLTYSGLNLSENTALTHLHCVNNKLTGLDLSKNTALIYLGCSNNMLAALDLSNNTALFQLLCSRNQLTELDVSNNTNLAWLMCENNQLTSIELGDNEKLSVLWCHNNELTSLDISGCPKLSAKNIDHDDDITIITEKPAQPTITTEILPSGKIGEAYSATFTASGTTPITWSVSGLPGGLSYSSEGEIFGTPAKAGTFSITVTAMNTAGNASTTLSLTIASGGGTETPEDEDDEVVPEFKAHQPVLEGQIIVNFFALLPEIYGVDYNNSYVKFDVLNDTTYNPVQEYDASFTAQGKSGTYYGFRCCLTSIQMADPITATLYYGDGKTIVHEYKLTDYLDKYYAASTTPEALRNIVGAMKDYGHYAQIALAEANGWKLGTDHIATEAATVYTESDIEEAKQAVEKYAKSWKVGASGIQSIGYRLVLDSDTALELFLRPASGYTGKVYAYSRGAIGITDTSANLAVKQSDGRYLVQISGIPAHRLDYTNTIRVVTENGEFDVKVSALSYVNTILNSDKYNDNMKKAVTSLYRYYKATKEYREYTGQK